MVRLGQVHAPVVQQLGKAAELLVGRALRGFHFFKSRLEPRAVLLVALIVACHGEDAPPFGQLAVSKRLEQGRHELAPGEVPGATKEDKVKGHGDVI